MKSFVVFFALVAIAAASETREKRAFLPDGTPIASHGGYGGYIRGYGGGYSGLGGYSHGYSSYSAPAVRVVSGNNLLNVNRVVEVPQVVSAPSYFYGYNGGYNSSHISGYTSSHNVW